MPPKKGFKASLGGVGLARKLSLVDIVMKRGTGGMATSNIGPVWAYSTTRVELRIHAMPQRRPFLSASVYMYVLCGIGFRIGQQMEEMGNTSRLILLHMLLVALLWRSHISSYIHHKRGGGGKAN